MKTRNWIRKSYYKLTALAAGGVMLQISFAGCDENLRDSLLTGIQTSLTGLVSTFIAAFFQSLMTPVTETPDVVVQAVQSVMSTFA